MALFRCSKCGCQEGTALCNYWSARIRDMPPLCSACDPKIDKWHGDFPRDAGGWSRPLQPAEVLRLLDAAINLAKANEEIGRSAA
jgi:hypothetical protein